MLVFAGIAALCALAGVAQLIMGMVLVRQFAAAPIAVPAARPAVTVLKPLHGVEPLLEQALESFFLLDYPDYQLVFGVQSAADPVLPVLERLRARYPARDAAVVVNPARHGSNGKVSNLINMLPSARHDVLVISDADIHAPPYFLDRVVAALQGARVGLVTTLYSALPGVPALAAQLGAAQVNYSFLPGTLLARRLGRQDCLGATMALRRSVLAEIGGLQALVEHLADDQVLGRLVLARGYKLALAQVVPATTVPEGDFASLYRHELRWARTIRALVPVPYAASVLQNPLGWAVLCVLFSGAAIWAWVLFIAVLALRVLAARRIEGVLRLPRLGQWWSFLLRDSFSAIIYIASFAGNRVDWRGQMMQADPGKVV